MEDLGAELAVGDLGVELDAVEPLLIAAHGGAGALIGGGDDGEALRDPADVVGVAHPADALSGHSLEQGAVPRGEFDPAVLTGRSGALDVSAGHPGHQLVPVAYPQDGDAQLQDLRVEVGGRGIVDAVGASGEYYALVAFLSYALGGHFAEGPYLGVDVLVAHSSCYELVVLSSEIEDEDLFHRSAPVSFLSFRAADRRPVFQSFRPYTLSSASISSAWARTGSSFFR